ncbi:unnamed protein product [Gadus morhua 'NCC']
MILFTELFMRTLPAQVRMALANTTIVGPPALAREPDRARRLNSEKLSVARAEFAHMEQATVNTSTPRSATSLGWTLASLCCHIPPSVG